MNQIIKFPKPVIEKLGYYVYLLIDPKTNKVFYVGKGTGNRLFAHINAAISSPVESDKLAKIRSIQSKGLEVKHSIIRHGLTEKEAFEVSRVRSFFFFLNAPPPISSPPQRLYPPYNMLSSCAANRRP